MVARVIITTMTASSTETITAVFEPPVLGFTSNREKKSYSVIIIIIRVAMGWLTPWTYWLQFLLAWLESGCDLSC